MTPTFFAAIDGNEDLSGAVYGLGRTEAEALTDAMHAAEGDYQIVPCSAAAYHFVMGHGGAPCACLAVSRHGVRLTTEPNATVRK